ncbi:hypothetical protein [Vibrio sp. Isolate30]|jgi:hypothetical protein|nr:hypothetical protein [Vibrio sp. Isolate30]MCG9630356.1 hypothetical protein [Vibrio sp. Isolate30]
MQNNYIKALAVKTYQEELTREYVISKKRPFHPPSFTFGFIIALLLIQFI